MGQGMFTETAYAKINLALHVRRRREDGYHELETLFAFVDAGDELTASNAEQDELCVTGEFAAALTNPFDNIVTKALGALPRADGLAIDLVKNLPVAAGLGGGSADAGAVFRLVERTHGLPDDWRERAARLGADVPACVESVTCIGRGTGTELEPVESDLARTPVLLVNPRLPLATGPVFKAWDGLDRGPLPEGPPRQIGREGRNDLETPAIALCPAIADVLAILRETDPWLARMSGSGATCFALYESAEGLKRAAKKLATRAAGLVANGRQFAMIEEAFRLVGKPRFGGILIMADHASNRVPEDIELGIDPALMDEHIAVDIGVSGVAERMAGREGTAAFLGNVSRLVCDTNREEHDPAAIPEMSDGRVIPGNLGIDREARLARFHRPFHGGLARILNEAPPALTLILHSYTPQLASDPESHRPWHCGLLYDQDDRGARLAQPLLEADGLHVGDQLPYSGKIYNAAIKRHVESDGRPYLYIEIRQDLIADDAGQAEWADRLTRICNRVALELE